MVFPWDSSAEWSDTVIGLSNGSSQLESTGMFIGRVAGASFCFRSFTFLLVVDFVFFLAWGVLGARQLAGGAQ